jgi:hypothetical protein
MTRRESVSGHVSPEGVASRGIAVTRTPSSDDASGSIPGADRRGVRAH